MEPQAQYQLCYSKVRRNNYVCGMRLFGVPVPTSSIKTRVEVDPAYTEYGDTTIPLSIRVNGAPMNAVVNDQLLIDK